MKRVHNMQMTRHTAPTTKSRIRLASFGTKMRIQLNVTARNPFKAACKCWNLFNLWTRLMLKSGEKIESLSYDVTASDDIKYATIVSNKTVLTISVSLKGGNNYDK